MQETGRLIPLCDALRFKRIQKELSARQVSMMAGFSESYLAKVESGAMDPSFSAFCSIAKVLDFTDAEILYMVKIYG